MYQHLLVPLDDTPLAAELIGEAVDFARSLGARITFVHVTGAEAGALYGDAEVLRATSPQKYAEKYEWAARSVLARAEMAARAARIVATSMSVVHQAGVPDAIVDTADEVCADVIVMASHERSSRVAALVQSRAVAVMTRAHTAFLLAVPGRSGSAPMRRCIARLRDEHRTIAAVIEGLRQLVAGAAALGESERRIAAAALDFLDDFAGTQHHPKEEQFLFARCRDHSLDLAPVLDGLAAQHETEHELLERARQAVGAGGDTLRTAIDELGEHVWRHMAMEEEQVLPHARAVLAASDWTALDGAFSGYTDPRFSAGSEQELRAMYAQLVNLFPH